MRPYQSSGGIASAFHATAAEIMAQRAVLEAHGFPRVLNSISMMAVVVNALYQLVFCNETFLEAAGIGRVESILGARLGEALQCVHAPEGKNGCGSSEYCSQCGAFRAMMLGVEGIRNAQDGMITRDADSVEVLDLRIGSAPVFLDGHHLVVLSIQDTSHEKRRRALEHIFFHDILNTVGGMKSILDCLCDEVTSCQESDAELLQDLTSKLIDEIVSQKQLLAAENNELKPNMTLLRSTDVLRSAREAFGALIQAREKRIELDHNSADVIFYSDFSLLRRVLGNMLKNALEATPPGGQVVMGCREDSGEIVYWVQNESYIPKIVRLKIFTRTFSTKGEGRGFGTYGIRLLTERYLGGRVDFESDKENGTIFRVRLPATADHAAVG